MIEDIKKQKDDFVLFSFKKRMESNSLSKELVNYTLDLKGEQTKAIEGVIISNFVSKTRGRSQKEIVIIYLKFFSSFEGFMPRIASYLQEEEHK